MQTNSAQVIAFSTSYEARQLVQDWCEAVRQRNADMITALYGDDASLIATLQNNVLRTPLDIHRYFTMLTQREDLRVTILEHDFRMLTGQTALHTGWYVFHFTEEGQEVELPARYSFVTQPCDGHWQIVHHHSSQLPIMTSP